MPAVLSKKFQHYLDLPPELRMMVVDEMETKDRIRFSALSKLSHKEAKSSKNYLYGLTLEISRSLALIHVIHDERHVLGNIQKLGFILYFETEQGVNYITCKNFSDVVLSRTKLDRSEDMFQLALKHFKNILQVYQNTVKSLEISVNHPTIESRNIDFEIATLNNLDSLNIRDDVDIRQFFPKTRKALKKLIVLSRRNGEHLQSLLNDEVQCKKILNIQQWLSLKVGFNSAQMIQISAMFLIINLGQLTEIDISNFIKNWRNDEYFVRFYRWHSTIPMNPILNFNTLANLLGFPQHNFANRQQLRIPHLKNERRIGSLHFCTHLNAWIFNG